ncbi:MAG: hypothetical protein WC635_11435 [Bacteriovorax sp.]|jgi:hypothetical protein
MKESQKGSTGDHRHISDPIEERKDFIKHLKENAAKEEKSSGNNKK